MSNTNSNSNSSNSLPLNSNNNTNSSSNAIPSNNNNNFSTYTAPYYRRTSYASIVSGTPAPAAANAFQPPTRAYSHLSNPSPSSTYPPANQLTSALSRSGSRALDMDGNFTFGQTSWARGHSQASLGGGGGGGGSAGPFAASPFGPSSSTTAASGVEARDTPFFIPAHLEGSRYAEQLREEHRLRTSGHRDSRTTPYSSNPGSLSTSSSSVNLHQKAQTHRGITHDVIERAPPVTIFQDDLSPPVPGLPSRWNEADKNPALEVGRDGLDVRFTGLAKGNDEAAVVRADHPMPPQAGIYYFEVALLTKGKEGYARNPLSMHHWNANKEK
jgi:hypothetical protein